MQGRPALEPQFSAPERAAVQPWQYAPITEDQLRNPLNVIPPDQRPRTVLRFGDQRDLLVSGLLDGGADIAQRPVVVDAPLGKGHVVLLAFQPQWRGQPTGTFRTVFNALLYGSEVGAATRATPGFWSPTPIP